MWGVGGGGNGVCRGEVTPHWTMAQRFGVFIQNRQICLSSADPN